MGAEKDYFFAGQIVLLYKRQNLMAEMILEMQNRDTQLSLMQKQTLPPFRELH